MANNENDIKIITITIIIIIEENHFRATIGFEEPASVDFRPQHHIPTSNPVLTVNSKNRKEKSSKEKKGGGGAHLLYLQDDAYCMFVGRCHSIVKYIGPTWLHPSFAFLHRGQWADVVASFFRLLQRTMGRRGCILPSPFCTEDNGQTWLHPSFAFLHRGQWADAVASFLRLFAQRTMGRRGCILLSPFCTEDNGPTWLHPSFAFLHRGQWADVVASFFRLFAQRTMGRRGCILLFRLFLHRGQWHPSFAFLHNVAAFARNP